MSSITSPAVRRRFATARCVPVRELFEETRATGFLCFHQAVEAVEGSAYSNQQESTWPEAAS